MVRAQGPSRPEQLGVGTWAVRPRMSLKAQRSPADTRIVHNGEPLPIALDRVLRALPGGHVVASDGDARLVVGPSGAFVLVPAPWPGGPAPADAGHRVHALAARTRAGLGDHLTWIPFLDPLLVTAGPVVRDAGVTVAPVDLLAGVLTGGPPQIDDLTVTAVDRVVRRRGLGRWRIGTGRGQVSGTDGGRIELCHTPHPFRAASPG
jgi:hypothetical protein